MSAPNALPDSTSDHTHGHPHDHDAHAHAGRAAHSHFDLKGVSTDRLIAAAFWINAGFMIIEAVGGWWTNSLALLADAAHMLNDVLSLGLTWAAYHLAMRAAEGAYTFGFRRAQVLAALADAASLGAVMLFIIVEAVQRLRAPEPVLAGPMLIIAAAGFAANLSSGAMLFLRRHESMNIRGAYLHLVADTLGSVLAVIAAILISVTGRTIIDPVLSLLLGGFVSWGAWNLLRESLGVLMERAPAGYDAAALADALRGIEHIEAVHDLHVWQLDDGRPLASVHVVVADPSVIDLRLLVERCRSLFRDRFHVEHATIQIEGRDWPACGNHCGLAPSAQGGHGHAH